MPVKTEADHDEHAHQTHSERNRGAQLPRRLLCLHGRGQPPLAEEIPDSDSQMKGRRNNSDQKKCQVERMCQILSNRCVGRFAVSQPSLRIQVPADVSERNQSGVALRRVEPVPDPWILRDVRPTSLPDINPIAAMKQNRQKNRDPFD